MNRFLKNYRLPENIEVLFLLIIGIIFQITDGSPFTIKKRLAVVWETELPSEYFSVFVQHFIKTILSGIVVARCLTTYAYVVSAMLVIFCILKDAAPKIILIWLVISGLKSICMTFVETLLGVYVCSAFGKIRKACVEFFISKALEITFATYLWGSVLNMYYDMMRRREEEFKFENWDEYFKQMCFKRQRARSLMDESILSKTAYFNSFEFKDVPQIILQMLRREEDMSQDSLLGPGMMLASVSNMGSFDNIKKAQSLGELGILDLKTVRIMDMDEDDSNTPTQKALKFLKLSWTDIKKAKERKNEEKYEEYKDIFLVDDKTWIDVKNDTEHIHYPKKTRTKIVLQEIPHADLDEEIELKREKFPKIELELKFGFSLFNFLREKNDDYLKGKEEEDLELRTIDSDVDEDEEENKGDDNSASFFMSNIKEEVAVNRIRLEFVSKAIKGNNYAKLYKEDYMNVIGHEVFDTASKLPKVTSLSQVNKKFKKKKESSPRISSDSSRKKKKISNDEENHSKSSLSINNLEALKEGELKNVEVNSNSLESSSDTKSSQENNCDVFNKIDNTIVEKKEEKEKIFSNLKIEIKKSLNNKEITVKKLKDLYKLRMFEKTEKLKKVELDDLSETGDQWKTNEKKMNFREKRKIKIKRTEKRINEPSGILNDPDKDEDCFSLNESSSLIEESDSSLDENVQKSSSSINSMPSFAFDKEKNNFKCSKQAYFVSKVSHRPVANFLSSYYDLKKYIYLKKCSDLLEKSKATEKNSKYFKSDLIPCSHNKQFDTKIWKSKVLKTAVTYRKMIENSSEKVRRHQNKANNNSNRFLEKLYLYFLISYLRKIKKGYQVKKIPWRYFFATKIKTEPEPKLYNFTQNNFDASSYDFSRSYISSENSYVSLKLKKSLSSSYTSFFTIGDDSTNDPKFKSSTSGILQWVNSTFSEDSNVLNVTKPEEQSETKLKKDSKIFKSPNTSLKVPIEEDKFFNNPNTSKKVNFSVNSKNYINHEEKKEEKEKNVIRQDSDESFSLFYSNAADLTSPLLDMKRFIYPDHIHYSYKHFKKKGFDVDLSGGLPLLVRESLTTSLPLHVKNVSNSRDLELEITRRPMDLSFATTDEFAEIKFYNSTDGCPNEDSSIGKDKGSEKILGKSKNVYLTKVKKGKKMKRLIDKDEAKILAGKIANKKYQGKSLDSLERIYLSRNNFLLEKLSKIYKKLGYKKGDKFR